jgi:hypothetical protein
LAEFEGEGKMLTIFRGFNGFLVILLVGWAFNAEAQSNSFEQYLREMEQIVTAMERIHDEASAARAAEIMGASFARIEPLLQGMDNWGPSEWEYFALNYSEDFNNVYMRMSNSLMRMVQNPDYMDLFIEHMQNMPTFEPSQ